MHLLQKRILSCPQTKTALSFKNMQTRFLGSVSN